jgi:hypothetical protein
MTCGNIKAPNRSLAFPGSAWNWRGWVGRGLGLVLLLPLVLIQNGEGQIRGAEPAATLRVKKPVGVVTAGR